MLNTQYSNNEIRALVLQRYGLDLVEQDEMFLYKKDLCLFSITLEDLLNKFENMYNVANFDKDTIFKCQNEFQSLTKNLLSYGTKTNAEMEKLENFFDTNIKPSLLNTISLSFEKSKDEINGEVRNNFDTIKNEVVKNVNDTILDFKKNADSIVESFQQKVEKKGNIKYISETLSLNNKKEVFVNAFGRTLYLTIFSIFLGVLCFVWYFNSTNYELYVNENKKFENYQEYYNFLQTSEKGSDNYGYYFLLKFNDRDYQFVGKTFYSMEKKDNEASRIKVYFKLIK